MKRRLNDDKSESRARIIRLTGSSIPKKSEINSASGLVAAGQFRQVGVFRRSSTSSQLSLRSTTASPNKSAFDAADQLRRFRSFDASRLFFDWENDFTIVQWDQPGGGATLAKNGVAGSGELTIERYTRDAIAVAEWARHHLGSRKVVVMGTSWGTLLGLQLAARRPDLVAAYVGTGQFVNGPRGSRFSYDAALKAARDRGDPSAIAELEGVGPPPYVRFEDYLVRHFSP